MPEIAHGYADAHGVRLHYAKAGAGRLLLFLHGFPEFWRAWREPLGYFGARGWLALAPDLRGYNLSDKPAGVEQYRSKLLIADIAQFAAHFSHQRFVLIGHDWGGALAWGLAIAHPELLSHLVIVNAPHPYLFWRELARNPAQQKASDYMLLFRDAKAERVLSENAFARLARMVFQEARGGFGAEEQAAYREAWAQPGALTGALNYYRASPLYPPCPADPGAARLALEPKEFTVRVPTLVLWGERDRALLTGCLDGLEQCVPELELVRVPEATHWIVHEQPARVCSEIERFLAARRA